MVACDSGVSGPEETTEGRTVDTSDLIEEFPRLEVEDNLPALDMNKGEFRIWTGDRGDFIHDIGVDLDGSGDIVDIAIYERNRKIMERFNCKLVQTPVDASAIIKAVSTDEDAFDLVLAGSLHACSALAPEGYFLDWYEDLPYVNLDQPWYIGNAKEALSIGQHAYTMIGELNLDVLRFTYCMFFNKQLVENYDLGNIYDVVNNGEWTHEYLRKLSAEIYTDLNFDGVTSEGDLLVLAGDTASAVVAYQYAYNNPLFTSDEEGVPTYTFDIDRATVIIEKLVDLYWNTNGTYGGSWGAGSDTWNNGTLMFKTGMFMDAQNYRGIDAFDFGIIPYPKLDENQDRYYSMVDGAHTVQAVPTTARDPESVSIIVEALNAETWKTVIPTYYDISMKDKFTRDPESNAMLDLISESRIFDFGYIYNLTDMAFVIQHQVARKSTSSASTYERYKKASLKKWDEIIEMYLDLG